MLNTNQIHFRNLKGDIFAGVTAAVVALPMALTFGVASGVGATAGLWSAILIGFFTALFGGNPSLISSPTAPMTVAITAIIANLTSADSENGLAMAFTVVMLAGIFQIIFGLLKLGLYISLIPYTVISGFMSGIGIILMILEIGPILGEATPEGGVMGTLGSISTLIVNMNPLDTLLAGLTLGILFFYPTQLKKLFPSQLLVLIVGTLVATFLLNDGSIRTIGEISVGLPSLQVPTFTETQLQVILFDSLVLGMLSSIDTLLTSLVAETLTNNEYDSNQELIGQGIGTFISGLLGGIPGSGETMGTVVNIQSGGKTALSGLIRVLVLIIVVLELSSYLSFVPSAVLAGIAFKVGLDIVDWDLLKRVRQISRPSAVIVYQVMALTVFVDLVVAVVVGVLVANVITIRLLSNTYGEKVKAVAYDDEEIELNQEERILLRKAGENILLMYISGAMLLGVAKAISREYNSISNYQVLVLDLSEVSLLDVTSSLALEKVITEALAKQRQVFLAGVHGQAQELLNKLNIMDKIPETNFLNNRTEALRTALIYVEKSGLNSTSKRVIPFRSKSQTKS